MKGSERALRMALALLRDGTLSIDADGRIWRHFARDGWGNRVAIPTRSAENQTRKGYMRLTFVLPGTPKKTGNVQSHRLIWIVANGPIPDGLEINHIDCNKANNRLSNLELVTPSGNQLHAYANGKAKPWSKSDSTEWRKGKPRITDEQKQRVAELRASGLGSHRIHRLTGISRTHLERLFKKGGAQCAT